MLRVKSVVISSVFLSDVQMVLRSLFHIRYGMIECEVFCFRRYGVFERLALYFRQHPTGRGSNYYWSLDRWVKFFVVSRCMHHGGTIAHEWSDLKRRHYCLFSLLHDHIISFTSLCILVGLGRGCLSLILLCPIYGRWHVWSGSVKCLKNQQ